MSSSAEDRPTGWADDAFEAGLADRYRKQIAFANWGIAAQQHLSQATVLIIGCGALGTAQAHLLARAGVGKLILVDRDFVDLSNLQRQTLFVERDVEQGLPKVVAAAAHLAAINRHVEILPVIQDVTWENIGHHVPGADVVLDGTDNFETRFLINDACIRWGKPWVYGGCLGAAGQTMTIVPGQTACLACLIPTGPPAAGSLPTCDTSGVLGTIIQMIAALQVSEALKLIGGQAAGISRRLTVIDSWELGFRSLSLEKLAATGCDVCRGGRFDWLAGRQRTQTHVLCGRNSVQVSLPVPQPWDLAGLARQLESQGQVLRNPYLVKFRQGTWGLTAFPDGRVIVSGTEDADAAKTWLRQVVGL